MVLASLTYAVAAMRMSRRGALAQQLNAIESLAAADIICTDKTGTLTESSLRVVAALPAPESTTPRSTRARTYAASSPARNGTLDAIAASFPARRGRRGRGPLLVRTALERTAARRPPSCWAPRSCCRSASWRSASPPSNERADESSRCAMAALRANYRRTAAAGRSGAARRGRPRGATAAGRARDGRVLPRTGDRAEGAVGRRAAHGRGHRRATPASRSPGPPPTAAPPRMIPRRSKRRSSPRRRAHLPRGQASGRAGASRPRPLRRDARRRRKRRSGPEGGAARDRAGWGPRWPRAWPTSCSCAATSPRCRAWSPRAGRSCATSSAWRSCM